MVETIGIVGLGAVGVMYAEVLGRAFGREAVRVIADAGRIERYERDGVYSNGRRCDFRYVRAEEAEPVDLLIFATKFGGLEDAARTCAAACGPETIVMSFLNGVTSEGVVDRILHPAHLLYCTVQGMDATKEGNRLFYERTGSCAFNELSGSGRASAAVRDVAEVFDRAGIAYAVPDDIIHQQWSKWMLNVGVNQVCAVHAVGYGGVQPGAPYRSEMIEAMREAQAVAAAEGVALSDAELEAWVALIDGLAPLGEPSMRQDTKAGRPTEVALFAGVVRELAAKHGIPTPVNDALWEQLA